MFIHHSGRKNKPKAEERTHRQRQTDNPVYKKQLTLLPYKLTV